MKEGAECPQVAVRWAQEATPREVEEDSRDQYECECVCARGGDLDGIEVCISKSLWRGDRGMGGGNVYAL